MSVVLPMAGSAAQEHHNSLKLLNWAERIPQSLLQLIVVITFISHQTDSALSYTVKIGSKPIVSLEIFLTQFATKVLSSEWLKTSIGLRLFPLFKYRINIEYDTNAP